MLQSLMCLPFSTVMDQWFGCLRLPHFHMGVPCSLGWFNASGDGDHILPHGRKETFGIHTHPPHDCRKRYQQTHLPLGSTHGTTSCPVSVCQYGEHPVLAVTFK